MSRMGNPFRDAPKFLLCPRCGEVLERAFDAVHVCLRCEGLWIAPVSLEKAFGTARWPQAQALWWRDALACPECAVAGATTTMSAAAAGRILIDRCGRHGLWLDRGELGRLLGDGAAADGDDDLAVLRELLRAHEGTLAALLERRQQWRASAEARTAEARARRARIEAELEAELAAAEVRRLEAHRERRLAEERAREVHRAEVEQVAAARRAHERAAHRAELTERHRVALGEVERVQARLAEVRAEAAALELALARHRQALGRVSAELEALVDDD